MHPIRSAHARQRRTAQRTVQTTDAHAFFNLLTDAAPLDIVEAQLLPPHRERLSPPTEILAMSLAQYLSVDGSCQSAVNAFVAESLSS